MRIKVINHPDYFNAFFNNSQRMDENHYDTSKCQEASHNFPMFFQYLYSLRYNHQTNGNNNQPQSQKHWIYTKVSMLEAIQAFPLIFDADSSDPFVNICQYVLFIIVFGVILVPSAEPRVMADIYFDAIEKKNKLSTTERQHSINDGHLIWKQFLYPFIPSIKESILQPKYQHISSNGL